MIIWQIDSWETLVTNQINFIIRFDMLANVVHALSQPNKLFVLSYCHYLSLFLFKGI